MTQNPPHQPEPFVKRTGDDAPAASRAQDEPVADRAPAAGEPVPFYKAPAVPGQHDAPDTAARTDTARTDTARTDTARTDTTTRTATPPLVAEPTDDEGHVVAVPRGTTDLGLLLLRIALGVILLAHGSQKLFALFDGPGINGFEGLLTSSGYQHAHLLAYVGSISELGSGLFLVLGLLTPLAGAAALGTTINAWFVADLATPGFHFFVGAKGQEYEMLLVVLAAVVVLVGPGRFSLDRGRGWATRPLLSSWLCLALGVAAGLLVWFLLNGARPFA